MLPNICLYEIPYVYIVCLTLLSSVIVVQTDPNLFSLEQIGKMKVRVFIYQKNKKQNLIPRKLL